MSRDKRKDRNDKETKKQFKIFLDRFNEEFDKLGEQAKAFSINAQISESSISQYRNRRIKSIPTNKTIEKLARYFGVSSNYLLGKSDTPHYEHEEIRQKTGLSKKAYKILTNIKDTDLINTINYLIEQEEINLLEGFTPIYNEKEDYNKSFEKAQANYEKELERINSNCIPILSTIHNYYLTQETKEEIYIINGQLKKLADFELKIDRFLADGKISTTEIIENTFLRKIENQLRNSKTKYSKRKGAK